MRRCAEFGEAIRSSAVGRVLPERTRSKRPHISNGILSNMGVQIRSTCSFLLRHNANPGPAKGWGFVSERTLYLSAVFHIGALVELCQSCRAAPIGSILNPPTTFFHRQPDAVHDDALDGTVNSSLTLRPNARGWALRCRSGCATTPQSRPLPEHTGPEDVLSG